jgi:hypothetical protein
MAKANPHVVKRTEEARETPYRSAALDLRGIGCYLLLAFGLTWAIEFAVLVVPGVRLDQNPPPWTRAVLAGVMWMPAISAFIVRRWITREGFASAGLRLGTWRAYLTIWFAIPLLFAAIYLITWLLGLGRMDLELRQFMTQAQALAASSGRAFPAPSPGLILLILFVASVTVGPVINALFAFGEEFGWTGYLVVKLLPLGKWTTAILYGLIWGLWHAPIIALGHDYPGHPWAGIAFMCPLMIAVGFSQLALRLRYGSIFLTTFLHACLNAQLFGIWGILFVDINPLLGGMTGITGLALAAPIGACLLARSCTGSRSSEA